MLSLEIIVVESEHRWERSSEGLLVSTSKAGSYVPCEYIRSGPSEHVDIQMFIYRHHVRLLSTCINVFVVYEHHILESVRNVSPKIF